MPRYIGVQKRYLVFKGLMQLNYNVLVFTHIYAMSACIMTLGGSNQNEEMVRIVTAIGIEID